MKNVLENKPDSDEIVSDELDNFTLISPKNIKPLTRPKRIFGEKLKSVDD